MILRVIFSKQGLFNGLRICISAIRNGMASRWTRRPVPNAVRARVSAS